MTRYNDSSRFVRVSDFYLILFFGTFCLALREKEGVQFSEPQMSDFRQTSQHRAANGGHLRCPVYVYHVSLDHLKNQLVHPHASRHSRDVFMRYWQKGGNSTWRQGYCVLSGLFYHAK